VAISDILKNYFQPGFPTLTDDARLFLRQELGKISQSINLLVNVVKQTQVTYTVATLPAAPAVGQRAFVTDATATTFASTVVGGGANKVPVYYDGAWKIG
jgi:hypothetical protein